MISVSIEKNDAGQRLDRFMRKSFPDAPLSAIFAIFRKKKIRANGAPAKAAQMLSEGDEIKIYENLPQPKPAAGEQECSALAIGAAKKLKIALHRGGLLVIDKPSGLACQSGSGIREHEALPAMLRCWAQERGMKCKPALAHRIDKETSGLVAAALDAPTLRELGSIFREKKIRKEYIALVKGRMPKPRGRIDAPVTAGKSAAQDMGIPAVTDWEVIERLGECELVRARIHTGRKHQIRQHFAGQLCPLAGDARYGDFEFNKKMKKEFGIRRLFLHSARMEFDLRGEHIEISSELPKDLSKALEKLRQSC